MLIWTKNSDQKSWSDHDIFQNFSPSWCNCLSLMRWQFDALINFYPFWYLYEEKHENILLELFCLVGLQALLGTFIKDVTQEGGGGS